MQSKLYTIEEIDFVSFNETYFHIQENGWFEIYQCMLRMVEEYKWRVKLQIFFGDVSELCEYFALKMLLVRCVEGSVCGGRIN